MVAVTHAAPQAAAPQAVGAWLDSLAPVYKANDRERFANAPDPLDETDGAGNRAWRILFEPEGQR